MGEKSIGLLGEFRQKAKVSRIGSKLSSFILQPNLLFTKIS